MEVLGFGYGARRPLLCLSPLNLDLKTLSAILQMTKGPTRKSTLQFDC
jgi:hypothetical protein